MAKVLLAGESWVSDIVDHKGYDPFPHTQVHIGCEKLLEVLRNAGHDVVHMRSHDVAENFPYTKEEMSAYDVIILSDIGSNSLLLPPAVFERGERVPNRLIALKEWVRAGGGLFMAGGYLSFQGFQGMANYAGTPVEEILPVNISRWDDRHETPQGVNGVLVGTAHELTTGLDAEWPFILGYQRLTAKPEAQVHAVVKDEDDPLLISWEYGAGRAVAYASDISPHWAPNEFMEWTGYQKLFDNIITWLSGGKK